MKTSYIIAIALIAVLIAIIVSMYGDSTEYATFETAQDNPERTYHIVGHLDRSKAQVYDEKKDPNYFAFYLEDSLKNVQKVVYYNPRPADFERSENVVVKGRMKDSVFEAKAILLKCPSKYNPSTVETTEYTAN